MTDQARPSEPEEVDVREVLRSYGWRCGPEFEERYVTDAWVFNLVNALEREATARADAEAALTEKDERIAALRKAWLRWRQVAMKDSTSGAAFAFRHDESFDEACRAALAPPQEPAPAEEVAK